MDNYNDEGTDKANWPTIFGSNLLYLIVLTLMIISSLTFGVQDIDDVSVNEFYFKTVVLEVAVIGLPALLYLLYKNADISRVIRLNRIKMEEVFSVIGMAIFGYGIVIFVNYIWLWLISKIGMPIIQPNPPVETGGQYFVALICIAVVPAIVEEFLFRGVILRGYERMGRKAGVIMSGLLFALLHMSIVSLPSIILLGIIISYLVQISDSIVTGMIYHFTNNAIAVTLVYISNNLLGYLEDVPMETPDNLVNMSPEVFWMGFIGIAMIMMFSVVMFILCFKAFKRSTHERRLRGQIEIDSTFAVVRPMDMVPVIIAMVIIILLFILEIFTMITMG